MKKIYRNNLNYWNKNNIIWLNKLEANMVEEIEAHILKRYELLNKQGINKILLYNLWKLELKINKFEIFTVLKLSLFQ